MTFTDLIFSWLVRSALLGLAILLVGGGAVLAWRQPVRRLRIIELVLCACLLAPFLGMVPGYPQLSVAAWRTVAAKPLESPLPPAIGSMSGPKVARPASLPASDRGAPPVPGAKAADTPEPALDIRPWIVAAYLVGVSAAVGWWLVGLVGLLRVLLTAKPAPPRCHELLAEISAGRGNRVRLLTSRRLQQPFASVWGRATIVLPEDLCGDERALRWCLAHEWAHVARHDFRAWLLAGLARALFFYQPLLWWLRRQLRLCQDFLADARAAGQASQVEDYAEFLTALAAKGKWRPAALGLSMRSGKSELYRRVIMLLKNQTLEDRAPRFWTVSATAAAVALAAITAAISLVPRAVAEEKPAAKQAAAKGSGAAPAQDRSEYYLQAGPEDTPPSTGPSGFIPLPAGAYSDLGSAGVRRNYHLTADQEKKLFSISQDVEPRLQELEKSAAKDLAKLPPQQQAAKQAELGKRMREETLACRQKVEKVLTREQAAAYKHYMMGSYALDLWNPRMRDIMPLGLSPQQEGQLQRLTDDTQRADEKDRLQKSRQLLAVLTPEQCRILKTSLHAADAAAPDIVVPARNHPVYSFFAVDDANSPLFLATDTRAAKIWVCPTLTENVVRKQLGLSGPQQESLLAIEKKFQADAEQAFKVYPATNQALDKLSKDEQKAKRAECERKLKGIGSDTIRQVEDVLGPQRWAAQKAKLEEAQEESLAGQLMWADDAMLRKLNLTPQQRAKLRESAEALQACGLTVNRETGEKALAVLTVQQRKKLEERLDQQGW
jgi:hypothetical protein